ncbi:MAG: proteasome subunit beta [Candidatus Hadarchaeia archaeon]
MEEAFKGTIVGVRYKEGVALASDSRETARYLVRSKGVQKIFKIQANLAVAVSGMTGDAQSLVDMMKSESNLYTIRKEKTMPPSSLARLTSNIFHSRRMFPYITSVSLGGIGESGPRLYFVDPAGGQLEEERCASAGSGSSVAYGVLEQGYVDEMDEDEALSLSVHSIQQAIERDAATGDSIALAKVDQEGFKEISKESVESYRR